MAREASKKTQAIRGLLDKNPGLTYQEGGKVALEKLGFFENHKDPEMRIDENRFNVTKHLHLKQKNGAATVKVKTGTKAKAGKGSKGKRRPADPKRSVLPKGGNGSEDFARTVQFISQQGGLSAVKQSIADKQGQIETLENEIAELTQAVESFESVQQAVAAAS